MIPILGYGSEAKIPRSVLTLDIILTTLVCMYIIYCPKELPIVPHIVHSTKGKPKIPNPKSESTESRSEEVTELCKCALFAMLCKFT